MFKLKILVSIGLLYTILSSSYAHPLGYSAGSSAESGSILSTGVLRGSSAAVSQFPNLYGGYGMISSAISGSSLNSSGTSLTSSGAIPVVGSIPASLGSPSFSLGAGSSTPAASLSATSIGPLFGSSATSTENWFVQMSSVQPTRSVSANSLNSGVATSGTYSSSVPIASLLGSSVGSIPGSISIAPVGASSGVPVGSSSGIPSGSLVGAPVTSPISGSLGGSSGVPLGSSVGGISGSLLGGPLGALLGLLGGGVSKPAPAPAQAQAPAPVLPPWANGVIDDPYFRNGK